MEFKDSALPQHPLIEKAFNRAHDIFSVRYRDMTEEAMRQVVERGLSLCDGFRDDQPPVALICCAFLAFVNKDSDEYDNIRHDYNAEVFFTMKTIDAFPSLCGSAELTGASLADPGVDNVVRISTMANVLCVLRSLNNLAKTDPVRFKKTDVAEQFENAILIGNGCRGANANFDRLFDEQVFQFKKPETPQAPAPKINPGPKPTFH